MLNSWYFKLFRLQSTSAFFMAGSPFAFDYKKRALHVNTWAYLRYAGLMFGMGFYLIFLIIQLVLLNMADKNKDFQYYYTYALAVCAVFDIISGFPTFRRPELAAATITEFWHLMDDVASKLFKFLTRNSAKNNLIKKQNICNFESLAEFMPSFNRGRSSINIIFNLFFVWLGFLCPMAGLFIGCHYFFFPRWPCYFSSLIPIEYFTFPVYIFFGFGYVAGLQMLWSLLFTNTIFLTTVGYYMWFLTTEYFCFPDTGKPPPGIQAMKIWKCQKTRRGFRSFQSIPFQYRKLQIFHLNFMEVCSSFIVPLQTIITKLGLFCNVSLIKYRHILNIANTVILMFWSFGSTMIALVALTLCAHLHVKTTKMLKTIKNKDWGSPQKNKVMKKFVRSCTPISYGYGRIYVIRKVSVLKFLRHLTRGTFRLLLTLKKKH